MESIRIENRTTNRLGCILSAALVVAAIVLAALLALAHAFDQPSSSRLRRDEAAALQRAALDAAWQPWATAAENVALVSLCLAVPVGISLASFVVIRRTRVMWPAEERHAHRPATVKAGQGDRVQSAVPSPGHPGPQDLDAA
ncbi:MAG: hypothetical protein QOE72_594 [Chloroflexota bacterium]|nr:hypothetical protein [Chloroflexota bacterium]